MDDFELVWSDEFDGDTLDTSKWSTRQATEIRRGGYWNGAAYRGMKQNLREAQRNMKRIRMEAKAAGHTISKSNYETVQVSY